ncbi:prenyltransferase/squalene oxidase repeat-containing protein [Streptomyces sp. WMMB 322]|uniref:prenyltransferase/squalene oxidase repeat-containing protein n=1 Tax=Streptomyces sp. WMMB 322 TaxID=1286821 RepID=UPI0006E3CA6B|nr:prenyltransferase/squalene oxidase repeat-containing protein [Streptomyces sp. WMMB 322]SCK40858.1 Prenyltransferase and squalene oxidase repeat-containing protein [Streptomyces sp. WMMB 322]
MFLRRSVTAVAAATALCASAAPAASAAVRSAPSISTSASATSASATTTTVRSAAAGKKLPDALYGKADPKYDGVWRQSMALLALDAAGAEPARKAVEWLSGQQCEDGSFTAYRADPEAECDEKKSPGDTNATAAAVQALAAVGGEKEAVRKALAWLRSVQNEDGGWGYNPGSPSDANSVSVVIGAHAAAGRKPEKVTKDGKSPYDALTSFQLGCDAEDAERGAFAYQPGKDGKLAANEDATAAAVLAGAGSGFQAERQSDRPLKPLGCGKGKDDGKPLAPDDAADAGAAHLDSVLDKNGHHLLAVTPGAEGKPDYANTADAVIALAASGHRTEALKALDWLGAKLDSWDKAGSDPAALAGVMLAVHATGGDAAKLKDTELLERLVATGPEPARMPGEKAAGATAEKEDGDGGAVLRWSLVGTGLAAGAGVGFLISARRKRQGQ